MAAVLDSIVLNLVNDKHSKTYEASIAVADGGYLVNFAYGAIGSKLIPGTKTKVPVALEEARKIYDKLAKEKATKPCECCGGVYSASRATPEPSQPVARGANRATANIQLELYEPIDTEAAGKFLASIKYGTQRKFDGVRLSVESLEDGQVRGWNRKGELTNVPAALVEALRSLPYGCHLDGEWECGRYVAFDILRLRDEELKDIPLYMRHAYLLTHLGPAIFPSDVIEVAELAQSEADKMKMLRAEHARDGEGLIFKDLAAPYMPGRKGVNVKLKFWKSATLRVCQKDAKDMHKDSIAVEAWKSVPTEDGDAKETWVNVGRVTMIGHRTPETGTFVEIRYLYLGAGERLYQPTFLGVRTDVGEADCAFSQLKKSGKGK